MLEKTKLMKLKDKVQLLEADHPDITDTGTDLTLNGTGDLKMKVDVGGNSTQVQYSGKNMLEYTLQSLKTLNTVGTWNDNIYTQNDISYTINEDLSIKVNGIASTSSYLIISNSLNNLTNGTEYKLSGCPSNGNIQTYSLRMYKENSYSTQTGEDLIFTYSSQAPVRINIFENTTINNLIFKPMIRLSSISDTTYEPYVGGTASPNPTYKQDINNVEGEVEVKGKSKNLADIDSIKIGKSWTGDNNLSRACLYIDVKPNSNYAISLYGVENMEEIGLIEKANTEARSTTAPIIQISTASVLKTTSNNTNILIIQFIKTNISLEDFKNVKVQIEPGSTVTSYVPHAENTVTFPLSQGQKLMLGDTLEDDGIHHKRAKVTANELKTVTTYVNQLTDFVRISFMISDLTNKVANEIPSGFCNYLKFLYDYNNESNHFYARSNVIYVFLEKTLLRSLNVTGVRAFLDEHPDLEIEYDLAKETLEDYTTTQQTAYNKLKEMQSYYDLTYVTGSSDNAQPILTAHAKKSLKVINDEISNINSRLTLLEE